MVSADGLDGRAPPGVLLTCAELRTRAYVMHTHPGALNANNHLDTHSHEQRMHTCSPILICIQPPQKSSGDQAPVEWQEAIPSQHLCSMHGAKKCGIVTGTCLQCSCTQHACQSPCNT